MNDASNIIDIKRRNIKNILRLLKNHESYSKKEMAHDLNLSFATVSNLCNELIEASLVLGYSDEEIKSVGRSPKKNVLNFKQFFIISLELHMTGRIVVCALNLKSEVVEKITISYLPNISIDEFISSCAQGYYSIISKLKIDSSNIIGVGVAVCGIYDYDKKNNVTSEIPLLRNQPIKSLLEEQIKKTVYIGNESNLCALYVSAKHKTNNIIYIYLTEGVGVGIINDGKILAGAHGYGSEISHIPLGVLDRKCSLCSCVGCLQTDLSISGFCIKYDPKHFDDELKTQHKWDAFLSKIDEGEDTAIKVAFENAEILGKSLSILVNLFDPSRVVIGGISGKLFEYMHPNIVNEIQKRRVVSSNLNPMISWDAQPEISILQGAADMVFERWDPLA